MRAPLTKAARLSPCGRYRYTLTRQWGPGAPAVWIMLNPSTADATVDDATVRRVVAFSGSWGYGAATVVNLYALRTPYPTDLWLAEDPIGPDNDATLAATVQQAMDDGRPVIAGWGVNARPDRVAYVLALPGMRLLQALGLSKDGHPRHPLYLRSDVTLRPYQPEICT